MGNEFGQTSEWNYQTELGWYLLQYEPHQKLKAFFKDLNNLFTANPAFYEYQFETKGFEWIDLDHRDECVMVYKRKGKNESEDVLVIFNMTPVERYDWKIRVYGKTEWNQIFCSDDTKYWGTGKFSGQEIKTEILDEKTTLAEINLNLPALSALVLR